MACENQSSMLSREPILDLSTAASRRATPREQICNCLHRPRTSSNRSSSCNHHSQSFKEIADLVKRCNGGWRPRPESNRDGRICSPLRSHSATRPLPRRTGGSRLYKGWGFTARRLLRPTMRSRRLLALCKSGAGLLYARRGKTRSLIAQLVEQSTVNRSAAGSSPAQGAKSHFSPN
jgi:hypothetical protein